MTEFARFAVPFIGLVLLGYLAGRWRPIPPSGIRVLERLLFQFGLPALIFGALADTPIGAIGDVPFILTVAFASYCAFAAAFTVAALRNGGDIPVATLHGLIGSQGRGALMAPAIVLAAFGAAAGVPLAIILAVDIVLLQALAPLLVAAAGERERPAIVFRRIGLRIALDPIVIAAVAGVLYAATGLGLPAGVADLLGLLGGIAPALGLLLVGLSLSNRRTIDIPEDFLPALAVKLFAHPIIVYLLLGWVGDFAEPWVFTAVMIAALPPAAQAVPAAARSIGNRAATAADLGLIASFVTLVALGALLIAGVVPADPFPSA
ncbi:MAG: hypothetical protein KIS96_07410 [Bauldia sp.]|nr:hypothetical protein [Bauldia sp.]